MEVLEMRSELDVPVETLWAWHERPGAFERLAPPWEFMRVLERSGGLAVGARTVLEMKTGPLPQKFVSEHTVCEPNVRFVDEAKESPFTLWRHEHRFSSLGPGRSALVDHVEYELPMGGLGQAVAAGMVKRRLERSFAYRHAVLRQDLARHAAYRGGPLAVGITGASGLLGTELSHYLSTAGHDVRAVRRRGVGIDASVLDGAHACIHLAGASILDGRWTAKRKQELIASRVGFTGTLLEELSRLSRPPPVFIAANAIGIYGDRGDEELDEGSKLGEAGPNGPEFLASLCAQWEAAARRAEDLGMRVVLLRIGVVMTARGGALKQMLGPFSAGVGGPLASGQMFMSWISMEDVLAAIELALWDKTLSGPVNLVAPNPVRNAELTKVLGHVLSRPAVMPVPAFALRALYGEAADGAVLASQRVRPGMLLGRGFKFLHPDLEPCLRFTLGR
jgi:uncharacterized protein (TIGR01777 family)